MFTATLISDVLMSTPYSELLYDRLQDAMKESNGVHIISLVTNEKLDVNQRDVTNDLQTIIMRLCYTHTNATATRQIMDVIVNRGADVNAQDSCGRTALMHTCLSERVDVFSYLLDNTCAQVALLDFEGNSVLGYAIEWGSTFAVKQILGRSPGESLAHAHNCHGKYIG